MECIYLLEPLLPKIFQLVTELSEALRRIIHSSTAGLGLLPIHAGGGGGGNATQGLIGGADSGASLKDAIGVTSLESFPSSQGMQLEEPGARSGPIV